MLLRTLMCSLLVTCVWTSESAWAQPVVIPGSPSYTDGVRDFVANPVVDLGLATTGDWDSVSVSGNGVYDPEQWAIVFKYSSVNVPAGTEVTFVNHPKNPPVIWLVDGDVAIDGIVNVDGEFGGNGMMAPTVAGPGGFRGGIRNVGPPLAPGAGYGPGGGPTNTDGSATGAGGSYGTSGSLPTTVSYTPTTYGNAQIVPLIGGSGGAGSANASRSNGGGGGGAILIIAQGTITVNGTIRARGGDTSLSGGGGAGGAVRLVATTTAGNGVIDTTGGIDLFGTAVGGLGRVRIESYTASHTWSSFPANGPQTPDNPALVFPASTDPKVTVTGINGLPSPLDPSAGTGVPDVTVVGLTDLQITVQTTNADPGATVTVRVTRRIGSDLILTATQDPPGQTGPIINWISESFTPGQVIGVIQAKIVQP